MFHRKKHDEMEQDIRNKSTIIANAMTETFLLIWFVICTVTKRPAIIPLYILLAQLAAKYISRLILRHRVGDERWKNGLILLLTAVLAAVFLLMTCIAPTGGAA